MKYEVGLSAYLTIFAGLDIEVEASDKDKAIEIAKGLAEGTWLDRYPSLNNVGTITVEVEEVEDE